MWDELYLPYERTVVMMLVDGGEDLLHHLRDVFYHYGDSIFAPGNNVEVLWVLNEIGCTLRILCNFTINDFPTQAVLFSAIFFKKIV